MKALSLLVALTVSTSAFAQLWVDPNPKAASAPTKVASAPAKAASTPSQAASAVPKCDALSKDATRKERARCAKK